MALETKENGCELHSFEKNRYFFGKLMTVRDFETEQRYVNEKRHLINRLINGLGVVCGLRVEKSTGDYGVQISPGLAIGCCGEEIVIDQPSSVNDIRELDGYPGDISGIDALYLCLKYDECVREPLPALTNASTCEEVCDYNRILERFRFEIKQSIPEKEVDFCSLLMQRVQIYSDNDIIVERIAPRWVNPDEVFDVTLAVKNMGAGVTSVAIAELLPAELTLIEGLDINKTMAFTNVEPGQTVEQSYLLKAQDAAVSGLSIAADSIEVGGSPVVQEGTPSEVDIIDESVSGKIVEKYFEVNLDECADCDDDPCIYLAKLNLNGDGAIKSSEDAVESIPLCQYVYNNPLLYELITCIEKRIVQIPLIKVKDDGLEKLGVVTCLNFLEGLDVEDAGNGEANIRAKLGEGLIHATDPEGGPDIIEANLGKGLEIGVGNEMKVKEGDGLSFDGNDRLQANIGKGLEFVDDPPDRREIQADINNGLRFVGNQIQPDYSTNPDPGKVCEANDPRLSNARPPEPHHVTHEQNAPDEIDVTNLSGVLAQPQKVAVQNEGTLKGQRNQLNFTGPGVSVDNDAVNNRVDINITGGNGGPATNCGLISIPIDANGSGRVLLISGYNDDRFCVCVGLKNPRNPAGSTEYGPLPLLDGMVEDLRSRVFSGGRFEINVFAPELADQEIEAQVFAIPCGGVDVIRPVPTSTITVPTITVPTITIPTITITAPTGTLTFPRVTIPTATITSPTGTLTLPTATLTLPTGTLTLPTATLIFPTGTVTAPTGTLTLPTGTLTFPTSTIIAPTRPITIPTGTITLPTGGLTFPENTITLPTGPVTGPGGTLTLPSGPITVPTGIFLGPVSDTPIGAGAAPPVTTIVPPREEIPLTPVRGVGPATAEKLSAGGINDARALSEASAQEVSEALGITNLAKARELIKEAKKVVRGR